ncbi:DUF4097 family beta strand repeat-containing protein [Muriicola sp. SD30]|uniref:DUF4097 family beta strand repeat-containing protein n=1 Tax=Muriicola sp. SD30 TaxID=3240936 RepID=UPI00350F34B1
MTRPGKGRFHISLVKNFVFLLILVLGIKSASGQKVVRKVLLLPHITHIQIDANSLAKVDLETISGADLSLQAIIEGEYRKDLAIELVEEGNTLRVYAALQPYFKFPNDKLSAHKVIAISLHIEVPEDKFVNLYGTSAQVTARGIYKELEVVLSDGQCTLKNLKDNVHVTTQSGNIDLETASGTVNVNSKYGTVKQDNIPEGHTNYHLQSNSGNITIKAVE